MFAFLTLYETNVDSEVLSNFLIKNQVKVADKACELTLTTTDSLKKLHMSSSKIKIVYEYDLFYYKQIINNTLTVASDQ